ncbi:hypothetical protein RchiOBHm_Chr2g0131771 [Rosa chinensis]|uniref:Uncharacterized protein n=1 Tax=Rosa chinensis TaxID=74649 RepID=A0A2P6RV57_ROSCH|nr:hypothetical protein RchiOBHm_Chr2g0131771 [Rosa chinensis]
MTVLIIEYSSGSPLRVTTIMSSSIRRKISQEKQARHHKKSCNQQ